ncbi:hypothetical protein PL81_35600 [Streptomyces sp. RSD-27]|nr:hypothetical protein PL81_35600 [Streptomyces sp. RSD-27]
MLAGKHAQLYAELQRRMARGGDLSPGPSDTEARFRRGVHWEGRWDLHHTVLERFIAENRDRPRGGHAVLMTAGAPGAGKSGALNGLTEWQREDSEFGRHLSAAHGLGVADYVVLDPDQFKHALFEEGGLPEMPPRLMALPRGQELAPAELSGLLHREASYLRNQFEEWAREGGYNLLYDATLANEPAAAGLLTSLRQDGYDQRVILSVEVPLDMALAQNADRWLQGRLAFEQGRDGYGGRMAPEQMIRALYAGTTTGSGFSIGRENATKLTDRGLATALITSDRGTFPAQAPATTRTAVFQQGEARVSIAAAGRLRSGHGTPAGAVPPMPGPPAQPRPAPHQPPGPGNGRTR